MQIAFDKDDLTGEVQLVKDDRGGWGVALPLRQAGEQPADGEQVWGTLTLYGDVRSLLRQAAVAYDLAAGEPDGLRAALAVLEALPPGSCGWVPSSVAPFKEDAIPFAIRGLKATIAKVGSKG